MFNTEQLVLYFRLIPLNKLVFNTHSGARVTLSSTSKHIINDDFNHRKNKSIDGTTRWKTKIAFNCLINDRLRIHTTEGIV